ncbi:MAG: hypothetical protein ACE5G0_15070, partial [Rhodothermales bacterium]
MKRLLLLLLMLGLAAEGAAQESSLYLSSQQQPVQISLGALYQNYTEDDNSISEFSIPLMLSIPVGDRFGLSLVANQASATGDSLESVSGVSDAQVGVSYYQRLGRSSLVVSLGVNLPSGKRELTVDEFETSIFLSQHFYNFRVPGFGQGFNISPGFVFAFPAGENVVLGVGASYQVKGGFKPQEGMTDDYDPGDELLVTGGLDYRIDRASNLSVDVTFTHYQSDALGDEEVYATGDKVTATAQWLHYIGPHRIQLVGRYRSQSKSTRPAVFGQAEAELRTLPTQFLARGSYRHQVSPTLFLGVLAQGRIFDETTFFESKTLVDLGL